MKFAVMVFAIISLTSCFEYLLDWEVTPQSEIVQSLSTSKLAQPDPMTRVKYLNVTVIV